MEGKPETKGNPPSKKKNGNDKINLPWRDQQVGYWRRKQKKKSSVVTALDDNPTSATSKSELTELQTPKGGPLHPSSDLTEGSKSQNSRRKQNEARKGESSTEVNGADASKNQSFPTENHSVRLIPTPPVVEKGRVNVMIGTPATPTVPNPLLPSVQNAIPSSYKIWMKYKKQNSQNWRRKNPKNPPVKANLVPIPPSAELLKDRKETEPTPSAHVPKPTPGECSQSQTQVLPQPASAPLIDKRVNSSKIQELKPKNQAIPTAQSSVPSTEPPLSLEASSLPKIHQSKTSGNYVHSQIFIQQLSPEILQRLIVPTDCTNPYSIPVDKPIYRELFQRMIKDNHLSTKTTAITEDFKKLNLREQLAEFTSAQSLTQNEAYLRWQFISDLYFLLKQQRPQCEVYVFGSLITGLADESSDIDVFVDLLGNSDTEDSSKLSWEDFNWQRQVIFTTVEEILKKAKCPHNPSQKFNINLVALRHCKVPIIKLVHHARINCDLSFLNRLSVQNTKLLRFYMNWDPKIFQFFALIRYWGKYHNLTGSFLIKNYVLALLGLVFLCEMGLVPPLSLLQSLAASERRKKGLKNPNEIDGWDASFCEDVDLVKNAFQAKPFPCEGSDEQIVMNLALEFFKMYGSTDLSKVVVCPLVGKIVPRSCFTPGRESQLSEDFNPYKDHIARNKGVKQAVFRTKAQLCVQDPFVLNLNVAKSAKIEVVHKFKTACGRVEAPVASLLDLFIPLPPNLEVVPDRKSLKALKNTNKLRSEIKSVLGLDVPPPSKENRGMEWNAVDFKLNDKFERAFLTEIFLHKQLRYQNWNRNNWALLISTLWNQFVSKFCKEFVFNCFSLQSTIQTEKKIHDEAVDNPNKGSLLWLPLLLTTSTEGLGFKPVSETATLRKKMDLQNYPEPCIHYQKISIKVTYPIWRNRGAYFNDFKAELLKSTDLKLPIMPKKRNTKKVQLGKPEFLQCINPLWLEGWTSQMVRLLHSEDFKSFIVDLYISYHSGGGICRPHIHFLLEKSEENGADVDEKNVELAIRAIHNSIRNGLEDYVMYRLANWILSPSTSLNQKDEIWNKVLDKVKQSGKMEGNANLDDEEEDPSSGSDDEDDSEKEN